MNLQQKTNNTIKPKVIAIVGATASGKTAYSIELAKEINGEIISADSRLVYKGFNITCAKPSKEEQDGVPHHMMDLVEPTFDYSAGMFAKEARKHIYNIINRGKTPIIVGGTGLYFRLLLENYSPPKVEPDFELREKLKKLTTEDLYETLLELDFEGAGYIEPNDRQKVIRAIEIVKNGGKPLTEIRGVKTEQEFDVEWIGRNFPRDILYERINRRVDLMLEQGMIDETKNLLNQYGRVPNITCTIGYKEIIAYLDGIISLDEALSRLKQNSRKYAKRQLTWFRKNEQIQWNCYPEPLKK